MAATTFVWDASPEAVFVPMAEKYVADVYGLVVSIANQYAPDIEAWMKHNHPWQNRTGAAEAGLHVVIEEMAGSMVTLILSHGADVDYGIWLEVKAQGRWGILSTAVDYWAPIIFGEIQAALR